MGVHSLNYTVTLVTSSGHSFTWSGQQQQGNAPGQQLTAAQINTLTTEMATDIASQMETGVPINTLPNYPTQLTYQQQDNNWTAHD
jgi:hypothetical protein